MDNLTFDDKISILSLKDILDKLMKHPNHYVKKIILESHHDIIKKINNSDISQAQKKFYIEILDDPDNLELLSNNKSSEVSSEASSISSKERDELESKNGSYITFNDSGNESDDKSNIDVVEIKPPTIVDIINKTYDINDYSLYKDNPQFIENYNYFKKSLIFS